MAKASRVTTMVRSICAIYILAALPAPAASAAEVQYLHQKQNVVVFPVRNGIGQDKAALADDFLVLMRDALSQTGRFMVMACDFNNVSVQRAVTEQKVKADEVKSGFSPDSQGAERAQKVCQAIATDLGIAGSLDTYTFDDAAREARIQVTVHIVSGCLDAKPVTIAATGIGTGKPNDLSQTESGIAISALDDACDKILVEMSKTDMVTQATEAMVQEQQAYKPRSHNKGFLPAMIGALLLGLALGG